MRDIFNSATEKLPYLEKREWPVIEIEISFCAPEHI